MTDDNELRAEREQDVFFPPSKSTNRVLGDDELTLANLKHMGGPKHSIGFRNWLRYRAKWNAIMEADADLRWQREKAGQQ